MQLTTDIAVMRRTLMPRTYVDTASAGMSANTTSNMMRFVFSSPCICGDGDAKSLVAIYSILL
jgi:hypothetical protein